MTTQVFTDEVFAAFDIPLGPWIPTTMVVTCPAGGIKSALKSGWVESGSEYARAYTVDLEASQSGDSFLQLAALTTCRGSAVTAVGCPVLGQMLLPSTTTGNVVGSVTDAHGNFFAAVLDSGALSVLTYNVASPTAGEWSQVSVEASTIFTSVVDMVAFDEVLYMVAEADGIASGVFVRVTLSEDGLSAFVSTEVTYNTAATTFFSTGGCVNNGDFLFNNVRMPQATGVTQFGCGAVDPATGASVSVMVPDSTKMTVVRVDAVGSTIATLTFGTSPGECRAIYVVEDQIYYCTSDTVYTIPLTFESATVDATQYALVTRPALVPHTFPVTPLVVYESTNSTYSLRRGSVVTPIFNQNLDTVSKFQMKYFGGYGGALFTGGLIGGVLTPFVTYDQQAVRARVPGTLVGAPKFVSGKHSVDILSAVQFNNAYPMQEYSFTFSQGQSLPKFYPVSGWDTAESVDTVGYRRSGATSEAIPSNTVVASKSTTFMLRGVEGNKPYTWSLSDLEVVEAAYIYGSAHEAVACTSESTYIVSIGQKARMIGVGGTQLSNAGTNSIWTRPGPASNWVNATGETMPDTFSFDFVVPIAKDRFVCAKNGNTFLKLVDGVHGRELASFTLSQPVVRPPVHVGPAVYLLNDITLTSLLLSPYTGTVTDTTLTNAVSATVLFGHNNQLMCVDNAQQVYELSDDTWVLLKDMSSLGTVLGAAQYDATHSVLTTSTGVYLDSLYVIQSDPVKLKQFGDSSTNLGIGNMCWNEMYYGVPVLNNIESSARFVVEVSNPTVSEGPSDGMIAGYTLIGVFAAAAGVLLGLSYGKHAEKILTRSTDRLIARIFGFLAIGAIVITAGLTFGLPENRNRTKPAANATPAPSRLVLPMRGWYGNAGRTPIQLGDGPADGNAYWSYYGYTHSAQVLANAGSPVTVQDAVPYLVCGGEGYGALSTWSSAALESYTLETFEGIKNAGWRGVVFYVASGDKTVTPEQFDVVFQTAHDVGLIVGVTVPGTAPENMPPLKNEGSLNNDSPGAWTYAFVSNPLVAFFSPRDAKEGTTKYDVANILGAESGRNMAIIPSIRTPAGEKDANALFNNRTSGRVLWVSEN